MIDQPRQVGGGRRSIGDIAPKLVQLTDDVLFGDMWARPGLSPRDRSLITVGALVALYRGNELPGHLRRALANGVTRDEIKEVLLQCAIYCGVPAANSAYHIAEAVFADAGLATPATQPIGKKE